MDWATQPDPFRRFAGAAPHPLDLVPPGDRASVRASFLPGEHPARAARSEVGIAALARFAGAVGVETGGRRSAGPCGSTPPAETSIPPRATSSPARSRACTTGRRSITTRPTNTRSSGGPSLVRRGLGRTGDAATAGQRAGGSHVHPLARGLEVRRARLPLLPPRPGTRHRRRGRGRRGARLGGALAGGVTARASWGVCSASMVRVGPRPRMPIACSRSAPGRGRFLSSSSGRSRWARWCAAGRPRGRASANRLSPDHGQHWPVIDEVAAATRKTSPALAATWEAPTPANHSLTAGDSTLALRPIVQQRRSAVALDGRTGLHRDGFLPDPAQDHCRQGSDPLHDACRGGRTSICCCSSIAWRTSCPASTCCCATRTARRPCAG